MKQQNLIVRGIYRHYKGNLYEVLEIAKHSETEEELVVYRALYGDYGVWVRPLGMFTETINGVPRFANEYGECMGFIVWQTICDEMELHLIATVPKFRRQGVARALLAQMFQAARHQQISRILLEVRVSNVVAQTLYTQFGFHEIALRKRYYNNTEDAVIMEKIC